MSGSLLFENIPPLLKNQNRWCVWSYQYSVDGKKTKVPYQINGAKASTSNPSTWNNLNSVIKNIEKFDGIGFIVGAGFIGIDFDDCFDLQKHKFNDNATLQREFCENNNGYKEISPSGNGLKIIGWCPNIKEMDIIKKQPNKSGFNRRKVPGGPVEFYFGDRFFTVTTNLYSTQNKGLEIDENNVVKLLEIIHPTLFHEEKQIIHNTQSFMKYMSVDDIIQIMIKSKNAEKYKSLLLGRWKHFGYNSQSEADCALMGALYFYTQGDTCIMKELFTRSGLYRGKNKGPNYIDNLIKFVSGGSTYNPNYYKKGGN